VFADKVVGSLILNLISGPELSVVNPARTKSKYDSA